MTSPKDSARTNGQEINQNDEKYLMNKIEQSIWFVNPVCFEKKHGLLCLKKILGPPRTALATRCFFLMKRFFRCQQETTVAAGAKETVSTDFDESNRLYFEELLAVNFGGFFPWLILSWEI